ncbi:hypothetical protein ACWDV4_09840 [Micromonospora sp. NPDC003197]
MSIRDVKAVIRAGIQASTEGEIQFKKAAREAAEASQLARHTVDGSHADEVEESLTALTAAAREVDQTTRRFEEAVDHADVRLNQCSFRPCR